MGILKQNLTGDIEVKVKFLGLNEREYARPCPSCVVHSELYTSHVCSMLYYKYTRGCVGAI